MNRRGFIRSALGLLAAPAIVRVSALMPISVANNVIPAARGFYLMDSDFATFAAIGSRKELVDTIWNIDPCETYIRSVTGKDLTLSPSES